MNLEPDVIAGVGPGGLKEPHDVKILICYFLAGIGRAFSREMMAELFTAGGITDYFTFSSAFEELCRMGHLIGLQGSWSLAPLGRETAEKLQGALPAALRERVMEVGAEAVARMDRDGEVRTDIVPHQNGYHVRCVIGDNGLEFLKLSFFAPDAGHAKQIEGRLKENYAEIYKALMKQLT